MKDLEKISQEILHMLPSIKELVDSLRNEPEDFLQDKKIQNEYHMDDLKHKLRRLRDSMDDFISGG